RSGGLPHPRARLGAGSGLGAALPPDHRGTARQRGPRGGVVAPARRPAGARALRLRSAAGRRTHAGRHGRLRRPGSELGRCRHLDPRRRGARDPRRRRPTRPGDRRGAGPAGPARPHGPPRPAPPGQRARVGAAGPQGRCYRARCHRVRGGREPDRGSGPAGPCDRGPCDRTRHPEPASARRERSLGGSTLPPGAPAPRRHRPAAAPRTATALRAAPARRRGTTRRGDLMTTLPPETGSATPAVTATAPAPSPRAACQGSPPLSARLAQWTRDLLADPQAVTDLLEEHGSPLNLHDFSALADNAGELTAVARAHGVDLRVFVARKANKTLGLIEAAHRAGLGLDLGSHRELAQALDAGFPARDIVVTAAIKPRPLLRLALEAGTTLVLDNLDEAAAAREEIAAARSAAPERDVPTPAGARPIALRLAPTPTG